MAFGERVGGVWVCVPGAQMVFGRQAASDVRPGAQTDGTRRADGVRQP
jgi:hypothetical protein